jgi:Uma2 family endonuclease
MGSAAERMRMSAQDFLTWDVNQNIRHEFVCGEVFAMAGAGEAHVTAAGNIYIALRQHLVGTSCRAFITDMKLRVEAADAFFYPDVMVTCSALDASDAMIKREALLLVEVLSPATAAYDRGDKFAAYRKLPSLREYLLVDTDSRRCDLFRKHDDGLWVLHPVETDQTVTLSSVGAELSAAQLWAEMPDTAAQRPSQPAPQRG